MLGRMPRNRSAMTVAAGRRRGEGASASSQPDRSRVARRKEQARQRLVRAAAQIIVSKGTEGLRLREIADLADVGFGSFYTHFDSKEELIAAAVKNPLQSPSPPTARQL